MKLAILVLLACISCFGQATLIGHTATLAGSGAVTTTGIDTSTCTPHCMLAVCASGFTFPNIVDSYGNTWQRAIQKNEDSDTYTTLFVSFGATVGTGHTVTISSSSNVDNGAAFMAFNNIAGLDKTNSSAGYGSPFTSGNVTPTNNDEVIIPCGTVFGGTISAVSPVTLLDNTHITNGGFAGTTPVSSASSYQIQTTATATTASWTQTGGMSTVIASIYSTLAPGTLSVTTTTLPEGFNGVAYSTCLAATGGISPYTWSLTGGSLSGTGLTLNTGTGCLTGTATTATASGLVFTVTDSASTTAASSGITLTIASAQLVISTTSPLPAATQYGTYNQSISGSGGTGALTYGWLQSPNCASIPEGMAINSSTGAITSSLIGGSGTYGMCATLMDSLGTVINKVLNIPIQGVYSWVSGVFPANAIFYHRMDAASTGLPVSTSPADQVNAGQTGEPISPYFGANAVSNGVSPNVLPNGIPLIEVPYNLATQESFTYLYQCYFGQGSNVYVPCPNPFVYAQIPSYVPIENGSTSCCNGLGTGGQSDAHLSVYVEPGGGNPGQLIEAWSASPCAYGAVTGVTPYCTGGITIALGSNAWWQNTGTNATIQNGSADITSGPILPYQLYPEEVIGGGTPTAPTGAVGHIARFTPQNHTLDYYEWPATGHTGTGNCYSTPGTGSPIPRGALSQTSPPNHCDNTPAAGVIWRLKASTYSALPGCFVTSPQAKIIATGLYQYGMFMADNGKHGLTGVPSTLWVDSDLACIAQLHESDFEPVNVSSLMISPTSFATTTSGTTAPTITSTCPLTTGTQGVAYSVTLTATAGADVSPITWGTTALPNGLVLDPNAGTISGTPAGSGTTAFTITAQNDAGPGPNSPLACSITINLTAPPIRSGLTLTSAGSIH